MNAVLSWVQSILPEAMQPWTVPLALALAGSLLGWILSLAAASKQLGSWLSKTHTDLDDLALNALRPFLLPLGILLGALAAVAFVPLADGGKQALRRWVLALLAAVVVLLVSRATLFLVDRFSRRHGFPGGRLSLSRVAVSGSILTLGGLLILSNLGVSVTPLLTALGVGSLAVALALQDTLGNLFAGFHILMSGQIRVGDFIELENGQKGYVKDIGWGACRILELPGNLVIVPNIKLSQMLVKNYHLPGKDLAVMVDVGVSYASDLEKVERVTVEVAREVLGRVLGGVKDFEPLIRFKSFADSSINFEVILRGQEYVDSYLITHEFIKELHRRYHNEGIEIPFPQRVVHMGEASEKKGAP